MLFLVSVISGVGYGGIQTVNTLLLDAAQEANIKGCVVSLHDQPDAPWTKSFWDSICAGGSRVRFVAGAISRQRYAQNSLIVVTHIDLVSIGRLVKKITNGKLLVCLHGVEAWNPLSRKTVWGLKGCDLLVAVSHYTLN